MSMYYLIVNEEKDSGCQVAKGIQAYNNAHKTDGKAIDIAALSDYLDTTGTDWKLKANLKNTEKMAFAEALKSDANYANLAADTANGAKVLSLKAWRNGSLSVPLSSLPHGVCVISTASGIKYKLYNK